ncbi:MAG: DUF4126 domain-containing protein [Longimicrobiales bacterium]|nr:DUF4126 domain-containing protein [Longimicrobiales bacterium]
MTLVLAGNVAGIAFASGLNLYLTVAALGILSRLEVLTGLPPGLQGLQGSLVIGSALALFLVETVIDRTRHADSLWDLLHTFIRPPAAALLAVAVLWGATPSTMALGAALAFAVALAAHGTKAGLRMTLNATMRTRWQPWISTAEDALAVTLAVSALLFPLPALAAAGVGVLVSLAFGPWLWGAFRLANRCIAAWIRALVTRSDWRALEELPGDVRDLLGETPTGMAPPRGTRAALQGLDGRAVRNGWLVTTPDGPAFVHRTLLGIRRIDLPEAREITTTAGTWTDILRIQADDAEYTLFMLKDGPDMDRTTRTLTYTSP